MAMRLPDQTAAALNWLAALILLPGFMIGSPSGRFACIALAALLAMLPLLFATGRCRVIAGVVLGVSLLFGSIEYPKLIADQDTYRDRVRQKQAHPATPTAVPPGGTR